MPASSSGTGEKNTNRDMVYWGTSSEPSQLAMDRSSEDQKEHPDSSRAPQKNDKCSSSTAYYVVIGNEIVLPISTHEKDVRVFSGIEQSQCARFCTANEGPKGEYMKCSSINYFPLEKKCEVYGILAEPHGPGSLVENEDVIYAEKFCLPTQSVICQEDEVFILYVQKTVSKKELKVRSSNSITSCLRHCLEHRLCKSAVFDSIHRRCMLHDVDLRNMDDVVDAEPGWVLIENGCNAKQKRLAQERNADRDEQITNTQWTEWSNCKFKLRDRIVRVRTRQCGSDCPDGGMQVQRC